MPLRALKSHRLVRGAALALALAAPAAHAAGGGQKSWLSLALTQTEDTSQADTAKGEDKVTIIGLSGAYGMGSGLGLGAKYFRYAQNARTTTDSGTVISGWGPLVSYFHQSGFYGALSYLLFPEKVYEDGGAEVTYFDGKGYVLDLGKAFEFGAWGLGVQLTYSKVDYEKVKARGISDADLDGTWYDTSLYPYVSVFVFL